MRSYCQRIGYTPSRWLLIVSVSSQSMVLGLRNKQGAWGEYLLKEKYRISTSRFGIGASEGSNGTPLGLHRIAKKIGGGWPPGTAFKGRQPIGYVWQGMPDAPITHRILWLDGLQKGINQGGAVDSYSRYIYIHGIGDETGIGRPASIGCIHLAGSDLLPLFDRIPNGTWVWIKA